MTTHRFDRVTMPITAKDVRRLAASYSNSHEEVFLASPHPTVPTSHRLGLSNDSSTNGEWGAKLRWGRFEGDGGFHRLINREINFGVKINFEF